MPDPTTQRITRWTLQLSAAARDQLRPPGAVGETSQVGDAALIPEPAASIHWLDRISAPDYRKLYSQVGRKWNWVDRLLLPLAELQDLLDQPDRFVGRLQDSEGTEVGFGELKRHSVQEVEICYFGLLPEYAGRGLGKVLFRQLLTWALSQTEENASVWLTTCEFDSPAARPFYRRMGFEVIREEHYLQRVGLP